MGKFYQDIFVFKILLIGDATVGKTALVERYVTDKFMSEPYSTIGVDFKSITATYINQQIKLQIWDTAGQERFRSIINSYYREADCVILCYDITNNESYLNLKNWYEVIKEKCTDDVIIFMVGTKLDYDNKREVLYEDAKQFAKTYNMEYCEISSKDNSREQLNKELFSPIIKSLYDRDKDIINKKEEDNIIVINKIIKPPSCCNTN